MMDTLELNFDRLLHACNRGDKLTAVRAIDDIAACALVSFDQARRIASIARGCRDANVWRPWRAMAEEVMALARDITEEHRTYWLR